MKIIYKLTIALVCFSCIFIVLSLFLFNYSYMETIHKIMAVTMFIGVLLTFKRNFYTWFFSLTLTIPSLLFFIYEAYILLSSNIKNTKLITSGIFIMLGIYSVIIVFKYFISLRKK